MDFKKEMFQKQIKILLEQKIGLSEKALGYGVVEKAVLLRMEFLKTADIEKYCYYIEDNPKELEELIELLVIPETWFFRNQAAFDFLKDYVDSKWIVDNKGKKLRILSIPCSTGEEPYSIAMTLMDTKIAGSDFHIDAVDISSKVLKHALKGVYGKTAFRSKNIKYRNQYFQYTDNKYKIDRVIKNQVCFYKGNLLDKYLLSDMAPYHIIFCRNLLIYLSNIAKKKAVNVIKNLLSYKGILFLGHTEYEPFQNAGFKRISPTGAFVCQRKLQPSIIEDIFGQNNYKQKIFPKIRLKAQYLESTSLKKVEEKIQIPFIDNQDKLDNNEKLLDIIQNMADKGALDDAFKKCQEYLDKYPANGHAHFLMGMMYQSVENYKKAEVYFNNAVYLNPLHCDALEQLSLIAESQGNYTNAENLRNRIKRILTREDKV